MAGGPFCYRRPLDPSPQSTSVPSYGADTSRKNDCQRYDRSQPITDEPTENADPRDASYSHILTSRPFSRARRGSSSAPDVLPRFAQSIATAASGWFSRHSDPEVCQPHSPPEAKDPHSAHNNPLVASRILNRPRPPVKSRPPLTAHRLATEYHRASGLEGHLVMPPRQEPSQLLQ
jgi:hypothetical protein